MMGQGEEKLVLGEQEWLTQNNNLIGLTNRKVKERNNEYVEKRKQTAQQMCGSIETRLCLVMLLAYFFTNYSGVAISIRHKMFASIMTIFISF